MNGSVGASVRMHYFFVKWTKETETESVRSEDAVREYNDWPNKIIDQMAYKSDQ